jgi:hypothetical protein
MLGAGTCKDGCATKHDQNASDGEGVAKDQQSAILCFDIAHGIEERVCVWEQSCDGTLWSNRS